MKYIVLVTPEAESNLVAAFEFIQSHSPANAVEWLARVKTRIATLERFPQRCEISPESEWFGEEIRQLLEPPYRLLFRIEKRAGVVRVLHIRHASRRFLGESDH